MIEEDLVQFISDLATAAEDRVYLGNAPPKVKWPYVVLRRSGGRTGRTLDGTPVFIQAPFSIHVLHLGLEQTGTGGYAEALPIANAIKDALNEFDPGAMGGTIVESARVQSEPIDTSEIDGDKKTCWLQMEVLIVHK